MSQDRADLIQQSSGSIYGQVYDDLMLRTFTGKSLSSQLVISSFFDVFIMVTVCHTYMFDVIFELLYRCNRRTIIVYFNR